MKKKYPVIAFLLGALPLLQAGSGALAFWGTEQYTQIDIVFFGLVFTPNGIAWLLLAALGFSWGWGYIYLGQVLRAVVAFFSGAVVNLSIFLLYLGALGVMDRSHEAAMKYDDFANVFFAVVLVVITLAGIVLSIDAVRLALRRNRRVREMQSGK